jgi:hypothetical protein
MFMSHCGSLKTSGIVLSAKMRDLGYTMLCVVAFATLITAVWYGHN